MPLVGIPLLEILDVQTIKEPIDLDTLKVDFELNNTIKNNKKLEEIICSKYNIKENNLRIGNSSLQILKNVISVINNKITIPIPDYFEFIEFCEDNELIKRLDDYSISEISNKSKAVLLSNPNNPTGTVHDLRNLIKTTKKNNQYLIVDEAYMEFCNNKFSCINYIKENNIIVLRTMSKFYNMHNDKLGYVIGPEEIIEKLELKEASENAKRKARGLLAINDLSKYNDKINFQKSILKKILEKHNCECVEGVTNFLMIKQKNGKLIDLMNNINVKVVDLNNTPGLENQNYVRIAVTNYENLLNLNRRLSEWN